MNMVKSVSNLETILNSSLTAQQTTATNTTQMVQILQAAIESINCGAKNGAKNEAPPKVEMPNGADVKSYKPDRTAQLVTPSPVSLKRTV
jgi:hypothetical protein